VAVQLAVVLHEALVVALAVLEIVVVAVVADVVLE
jgi:hypothetical protein